MEERHFHTLVERYSRLISHGIRRICGRRFQMLIPDVEQEVRLSLWQSLQQGIDIKHPATYLYRVAMRTGLRMVKHHTRALPAPADVEALSDPSPKAITFEERLMLEQALNNLPEEQRRALKAYWAGMNHLEIAVLYGWTPSQGRHRVYRALDALRDLHRRESA